MISKEFKKFDFQTRKSLLYKRCNRRQENEYDNINIVNIYYIITSGFLLNILFGQKLHLNFFSPSPLSSGSTTIISGWLPSICQTPTPDIGLETSELVASPYSAYISIIIPNSWGRKQVEPEFQSIEFIQSSISFNHYSVVNFLSLVH